VATKADGKGRQPARRAGARATTKSPTAAKRRDRPRRRPARAPEPAREALPGPEPDAVALSAPEPTFAACVSPPQPEPSRPAARRAIFLDVENTSRPQHLTHVIDHLAVDRHLWQTELVAVANWKVVGHDSARLLAKAGAHLVHSAPLTGVRDWSDLRIAVAAGMWLASARPGDEIEIVSDDRAFDAVGDVAASLGITFRRLSYRRLVKEDVTEIAGPESRPELEVGSRGRRRRGGRGRSGRLAPSRADARERDRGAPPGPAPPPRPSTEPILHRGPAPHAAAVQPAEAHTAPHDEIVSLVQELVATSPGRRVSIDTLANVLKGRGFRRPSGSPRLMTRLRRIRQIAVSPSGTITRAADGAEPGPEPSEAAPGDVDGPGPAGEEPASGAAAVPGSRRGRRRRRRRRGGGHRAAPQPVPAG